MADEMSPEEVEQFQKWLKNKQARKVNSTARRSAMADLRKAHGPEYTALVKKYGGTVRS